MDWLTDPEAWIALFTLTALEIVLGIDNIIFISILAGRLPGRAAAARPRARPRSCDDHADRCCCSRSPGSCGFTAPLFTSARARLSGARPDPDRRRSFPAGEKRPTKFTSGSKVKRARSRPRRRFVRGRASSRSRCSISCSRSIRSSPPSAWSTSSRSWSRR